MYPETIKKCLFKKRKTKEKNKELLNIGQRPQ